MGKMSRARRTLCAALLVVLGFTLGCSEFIVIGIEPDIAQSCAVSLSRAGELMSSFAALYAVCTPLLALFTGRFRRYSLLLVYLIVFVAGNLLSMLASSFDVLLVSRMLMGIVSGALLAVAVTYISDFVSPRRVPVLLSIVYASYSVAMVLSTSLGKLAAEFLTWHAALEGTFALSLVTSVLLLVFLPRAGSTDAPATAREQLPLGRDPRVLAGIFVFVFGVASTYVFYGYITPYLQDVLGMSAVGASTVLLAYGAVCMLSNLLSGWFAVRFPIGSLIPVFIVQGVLLASLTFVGASLAPALGIIVGIALCMYILSTPCAAFFVQLARSEYPKALTLAASIEPMAFNIGIALGTAVGGQVVSGAGLAMVGIAGSAFSVCAVAAVALMARFIKLRAR